MKRLIRATSGLAAALLLGACSSAPTRFHTLIAPAAEPAPATATAPYRIELLPVGIPQEVDQPQLVIRQSSDRVALLEGEQWIGPLGDQIRGALSAELVRRLGAEDVYDLPHGKDKPVYRIKLDVRRFDSVPGSYAMIAVAWSIRGRGGKQVMSCTDAVKQPVGAGYSALVQGHQHALAELARNLAMAVQRLALSHAAVCPLPSS